MIELSVIIVSYNVKFYLEQALRSIIKALQGIESEIIVVDNGSGDGSGNGGSGMGMRMRPDQGRRFREEQ